MADTPEPELSYGDRSWYQTVAGHEYIKALLAAGTAQSMLNAIAAENDVAVANGFRCICDAGRGYGYCRFVKSSNSKQFTEDIDVTIGKQWIGGTPRLVWTRRERITGPRYTYNVKHYNTLLGALIAAETDRAHYEPE